MAFTRYAIYFTPPAGPLSDFGAAWLGWDAVHGTAVAHPEISDLPAPISEITEAPRRYGLHATITPPFRLAEGSSEANLVTAFAGFCATTKAVTLSGLDLAPLGRFLALVPRGDQDAPGKLAAATVAALDHFRAPLTPTELARRRVPGLTAAQEALLLRWGYPYVMEAFRFHITLTGKRPRSELNTIRAALAPHLTPRLPRPFPLDALSLMGEDDTGSFHLIFRHGLAA